MGFLGRIAQYVSQLPNSSRVSHDVQHNDQCMHHSTNPLEDKGNVTQCGNLEAATLDELGRAANMVGQPSWLLLSVLVVSSCLLHACQSRSSWLWACACFHACYV